MSEPEQLQSVLQNIKSTSAQTTEKNAVAEFFEKYRAKFPEVFIDDATLFYIKVYAKKSAACKKCTGYPCKLFENCKGQKPMTRIKNGTMEFQIAICEHYRKFQEQNKANRLFKAAKIPPMYVGKTFADYQVDADNKNSVAWAKKLENLYLFGNPGTGKTFLAAVVAQEFLKQGKSVIFCDVPTLLDQLKGTFEDNADSKLEDLMQALAEVDVLVLDDLGSETPTEWAVERMYLIVNNRYNAGKKIIVTSNYSPADAEMRLNNPKTNRKNPTASVTGSRIISRINQMCRLTFLGGADRRNKNRR